MKMKNRSNGSPAAAREEQQSSVWDTSIYEEINNVNQYFREQDFKNLVEIL